MGTSDAEGCPNNQGPRRAVGLSSEQGSGPHMLSHVSLQMSVNNPHRPREGTSFFFSLVLNIEFQPGS